MDMVVFKLCVHQVLIIMEVSVSALIQEINVMHGNISMEFNVSTFLKSVPKVLTGTRQIVFLLEINAQ